MSPVPVDSLVRRPTTSVPTILLYLVPVMAMLVLGGVYVGVSIVREQIAKNPIVVMQDQAEQESTSATATSRPQQTEPTSGASSSKSNNTIAKILNKTSSPNKTQSEDLLSTDEPDPTQTVTLTTPELSTQPLSMDVTTSSQPSSEASASPTTLAETTPVAPKTWKVGRAEQFSDLKAAWDQAGNGDTLELAADLMRLEVGALTSSAKRLRLVGATGQARTAQMPRTPRPAIYLTWPAEREDAGGLWNIQRGALEIEGIDFWIDVRARKPGAAEVAFIELFESDVQIVDCSFTVLQSKKELTPLTLFRVQGERHSNQRTARVARHRSPPKSATPSSAGRRVHFGWTANKRSCVSSRQSYAHPVRSFSFTTRRVSCRALPFINSRWISSQVRSIRRDL